jgi:hypothetical protein
MVHQGEPEMYVYGKITNAVHRAGFEDFRVVRSDKKRRPDTLVGIEHILKGTFCPLDPDHGDQGLQAAAITAARSFPEGFGPV